ncbi:hypothetical protein [Bradyrhizobium sp. Ash2021]|uniref:hypothetical protein n=1 Tax=Bradyrhizobium sp. Ash2021 TaxID=2954771 RepID=UPI0028166F7B|nr:hypothetical protein [Bradyrhizobium sp. Ash2021]WMT74980.1 hypothetical protein NL528_00590 [Bradyrhizobium sp. Ash2021]
MFPSPPPQQRHGDRHENGQRRPLPRNQENRAGEGNNEIAGQIDPIEQRAGGVGDLRAETRGSQFGNRHSANGKNRERQQQQRCQNDGGEIERLFHIEPPQAGWETGGSDDFGCMYVDLHIMKVNIPI